MCKRSPSMLLLLALLLTTSHAAMAAHEVTHTNGPDDTQQCPLCVSGTQPSIEPVPDAVPKLPHLENIHTIPAGTDGLQSNAVYHDQHPRAPPSIA